jgi:hypothetical protein
MGPGRLLLKSEKNSHNANRMNNVTSGVKISSMRCQALASSLNLLRVAGFGATVMIVVLLNNDEVTWV